MFTKPDRFKRLAPIEATMALKSVEKPRYYLRNSCRLWKNIAGSSHFDATGKAGQSPDLCQIKAESVRHKYLSVSGQLSNLSHAFR